MTRTTILFSLATTTVRHRTTIQRHHQADLGGSPTFFSALVAFNSISPPCRLSGTPSRAATSLSPSKPPRPPHLTIPTRLAAAAAAPSIHQRARALSPSFKLPHSQTRRSCTPLPASTRSRSSTSRSRMAFSLTYPARSPSSPRAASQTISATGRVSHTSPV